MDRKADLPGIQDNSEYFVDERGKYFCLQNVFDKPNKESLPKELTDIEVVDQKSELNITSVQTMTKMQSRMDTGEEGYMIVTEDEDSPIINIAFNTDQREHITTAKNTIVVKEEMELAEESENSNNEIISCSKEEEMMSKHRKSWFKCSICSYSSHKRYLLLRHMESHSNDCLYTCQFCECGFKRVEELQDHENMNKGLKPFDCKHCPKAFTTRGQLMCHTRYKHTLERLYKCQECEYSSVELPKLRRHQRSHTGERPYQCRYCTYAATDTFKLNRHLRTHTGEKPYQCDICEKRFTQASSLKTHRNGIHNAAKKQEHPCELCPVRYDRKFDLRKHIQRFHTADQLYKCSRCGINCPDRYSHNLHVKTHKELYKCGTCPYASAKRRFLVMHMRTHTAEKPFVCEHCNQSFRQKHHLRRHTSMKHEPGYRPPAPKEKTYTCGHCQKQYARKGYLIRHMRSHDPDTDGKQLKLGNTRSTSASDMNKEVVAQNSQSSKDLQATIFYAAKFL